MAGILCRWEAAAVGVRLILERPVETIETNIVGTEMVLRAATGKRARVVLASTSEVYGKNDAVPLSEEDDRILGPTTKSRWSYACSKAIDEFLGLAYYRERGGEVVNVGSSEEVTIGELAERVKRLAGSRSPLVFVPYEEAYQPGFEDLRRRVPSIAKAERVVGYRPRVPLDETLRRVLEFLRTSGRR